MVGLLVQKLRDQGELGDDPVPQASRRNIIEMVVQVPQHTTCSALDPFQCFARALELLAMGVTAHLQR
jgi:hypothetical protein